MITHGNKQISEIVYARKASEGGGAVRLTNIIRGAQVVFGGLKPDVKMWLKKATKAAILAAFGQDDGWQVIGATNAYLNALEATDQTKASALAGFINEDPMLVCSLGIQPQGVQMPIRWLYPDTVGNYFNTGFNAKVAPTCEVLMIANNNNDTDYWGNSAKGNACYFANFKSTLQYYRYGSSSSINTGVALPIGEVHLWSVGKEIKLDGVLRYTTSNTYTPDESQTPIYIFRSGRGNPNTFKLAMFRIYDGEELKHTFIPLKRNGVMELIDLETGTLATRVGTFTESYTLQDGVTPWTQLNQTP